MVKLSYQEYIIFSINGYYFNMVNVCYTWDEFIKLKIGILQWLPYNLWIWIKQSFFNFFFNLTSALLKDLNGE